MSRVIKFRAWDAGKEAWVYFGLPWEQGDLGKQIAPLTVGQFTGLTDKNGKEIYEGDILCIEDDVIAETIGGFPRYEKEGKILAVVFEDGSFKTSLGTFPEMKDEYGSNETWEVIGNIYENPDLLSV